MSVKWDTSKDLRLISLYRNATKLWNTNEFHTRNLQERKEIWIEIAISLGYQAKEFKIPKNRMGQLRSRFTYERKSRPAGADQSSWTLYKELRFLEEHIHERGPRNKKIKKAKSKRSIGRPSSSMASDVESVNSDEDLFEVVPSDDELFGDNKLHVPQASSTLIEVPDLKSTGLKNKEKRQKECEAFGQFIAVLLNNFSDDEERQEKVHRVMDIFQKKKK